MEFKEWCDSLKKELDTLSKKTAETIPYTVNELLSQCESAATGEPDGNANVKIALVGTFSTGKSSFLNAIFDRDLTAVNINRTTRCRTDFTYGPLFRIIDVRKDNKEFSPDEYQRLSQKGNAKEESHYVVSLPDPRLEGIQFIDTPGFDPPQDGNIDLDQQDAAISQRAADDADVVFFLINANDGTIRDDCLQYMQKLNVRTTPDCNHPLRLVIILNQADKKYPDARQMIVDEVKNICQKNGIRVEDFILHTARKPQKNLDFYQQCQNNIWKLVKKYQEDKKTIIGNGTQISSQSLVDLRDILEKFTDFQTKRLENQKEKIQEEMEGKIGDQIKEIAKQLKFLMLNFVNDNRGCYSNYNKIPSSVVFFYDWKAYITDDEDRVIPTGNKRDEILQKIREMLNDYSIPSVDIYSNRLLDDINTLIVSVFREDDDNGKRCGRTKVCDNKSDANEKSREWQNEFSNTLEDRADAFFHKHVKSALSSLLNQKDTLVEQNLTNDLCTFRRINKLLFSEFPSLHEKDAFQHPVLEMSCPIQRKYLALLNIARMNLDFESSQKILDEMQKLNCFANVGFTNEELSSLKKQETNQILFEPVDWQENQRTELLARVLMDVGFADTNPRNEKKFLDLFANQYLFHDVDMNSMQGIFTFGTYAATAKDDANLAKKAVLCKNYLSDWSYLMSNRGLDAKSFRAMESAVCLFDWQEIANMFKTGNFTTDDEGELLLERCVCPFRRDAADFLIAHGCDVQAVSGDGNVMENMAMMLSDEDFSYLLDHGVPMTKDAWKDLFLYMKASLVAIATKRDPKAVPTDSLSPYTNLETLKAYGENGGNLNVYLDEYECSLVDLFVQHDQNDCVEYLRARGIHPSKNAKSINQIHDEIQQAIHL